ncbi:VCBS repeat-containing protein [Nocardiopsis sp. MG754419]|uniref:FG-GAP repeat domain-containing protein n=1 Tax=Nocardiopsis sp. MG754419 TaxID=2259865 RepID=UPI001BA962B8|nr:VCBS repeat-containing protein [Nocardiopsis sp. MG754419]MBR8745167.1 VCBS repeat-containing protein [Nocardiopsis sp. MG754419]
MKYRTTLPPLLAVALVAAVGCGTATTDLSDAAPVRGENDPVIDDTNGDGHPDLPIDGRLGGAPDGEPYVGALLGGENGLDPDRAVVLTRTDLGLPEAEDPLEVLDTGDLDGDGYTDLVIAAPGGGHVVWGGPEGLTGPAVPLPWLSVDDPTDMYAISLVVGDMDGDGHTDVAVLDHLQGTPVDTWESTYHRGPFDRDGAAAETRDLTLPDDVQDATIEAFDADGDAYQDLLVVRGADESPVRHLVLRSGPEGPAQETVGDTAPGHVHTSADVDGDGVADLLVGVSGIPNNEPGHDDELHPGRVDVHLGAEGYLDADPIRIDRDTEGVAGAAEDGDGFGNGLLVGDVDGDGVDDVVAMTGPSYAFEEATLLLGGAEGLTGTGSVTVEVPSSDLGNLSHHALTDIDGDGHADLVLSSAHPAVPSEADTFAVFLGGPEGFADEPDTVFTTEGL